MTFNYYLGEAHFQMQVDLPGNLAQQFAYAARTFSYTGALPKDWKRDYFAMFLNHAADPAALQAILQGIKSQHPQATGDSLLEYVVAFVQTAIAYDQQAAYQIKGGKIHYPSETLVKGKGVCADKTILLAALLQQLGYRIAIFSWERANHMALGLAVGPGEGNFGSSYAMVETTAATTIGTVPERYAGGIKLDGRPEIVEIGKGQQAYKGIAAQRQRDAALRQQYGADFLQMSPAQQRIHMQMQPLKAELEQLAKQLKACRGTLAPAQFAHCQQLNLQHNAKVEAYNELVAQFNQAKA